MTMLTKEEAKAFLSKTDLDRLMQLAEDGMLRADVGVDPAPMIIVRGAELSLLDVLELLGAV